MVVVALRDKSCGSLSPPVVHGQIRGWFQAGLLVLEACGLMVTVVTITAWTPIIPVAWRLGSCVFFLLASSSLGTEIWAVTVFPSRPLRQSPFHHCLFVCFLWWLRFALWDTSFLLFPNSTSKSWAKLRGAGRGGWLISLYQLSKVMPLRVDIWRKFVIRLGMWSFQLRCFCYAS